MGDTPGGRPPGLVLQHDDDSPPAILAEWLDDREIPYDLVQVATSGLPGEIGDRPWICSLGSEQTPGRPGAAAWVGEEIALLERALAAETPVLGLCFGGQALAAAAGGAVHPADPPEIGWIAIATSDERAVPAGPWLHYHLAQLELPPNATELARSPAGVAAFRLGTSLGIQFHPESTPEIGDAWAVDTADRLASLGIDPARIAADGKRWGATARQAALRLFDAWVERALPKWTKL